MYVCVFVWSGSFTEPQVKGSASLAGQGVFEILMALPPTLEIRTWFFVVVLKVFYLLSHVRQALS